MFDEIVFYSFTYIFIGTIFILCTLLWAYLKKRLDKKCKNRQKDILIYILCIIIWPIVILILLYDIYEEWKDGRNDKANEFELKITDLVKKYERCEIELREFVCDPLNAVPPVPFGHLNGAWLKFCEQLEFQDELWTFDLIWPSPWGTQIRYAGYAAVRNSKIKTIFYTE